VYISNVLTSVTKFGAVMWHWKEEFTTSMKGAKTTPHRHTSGSIIIHTLPAAVKRLLHSCETDSATSTAELAQINRE